MRGPLHSVNATFKSDDVFVVAEAGVNHNGSIKRALQMVEAAARAGADAVKFQTFRASSIATQTAHKADYQKETTGRGGGQASMLRALELDASEHLLLRDACAAQGIEFMSTPFDDASLRFLVEELEVSILKASSGDLTNAPLLLAMARTGKPVILSTGMSELQEVREALQLLAFGYVRTGVPAFPGTLRAEAADPACQKAIRENVVVLHCTSAYPASPSSANLRAMKTLSDNFGVEVGYSDHTLGWHISLAAVARGAKVVEKHFTLDRTLPGPDHRASLTPSELVTMVAQIRDISSALGDGVKQPAEEESSNRIVGRRGIVAAGPIAAGMKLRGRLALKRPAGPLSPSEWWQLQEKLANRDYEADEPIDADVLST